MRRRLVGGAVTLAMASVLAVAGASSAFAAPSIPDGIATPAAGSIDVCAQAAFGAGFQGQSLVTAIAIGMAESGCNPYNDGHYDGHTFYGIWQIEDIHPQGNPQCGHDPLCNAQAAYAISASGTDWCPWQTWSGAGCGGGNYDDRYAQFIAAAQAAAAEVTAPSIGPGNKSNSGIDDVSGDGHADLLWSDGASVNYLPDNSGSNPGGAPFVGDSTGVVQGLPAGALVGSGAITGHATADLFIYDPGTDDVRLYPGVGGGAPYSGAGYLVATQLGGNVKKIFAADVTGDGYADLVYTKTDGSAWFLPNNSASTSNHLPFTGEQAVQIVHGLPSDAVVTMGDLNGDGFADLLYVSGGNLFVLMNNILAPNSGGTPFPEGSQQLTNDGSFTGVEQMTAADLSGDGVADLLWADGNGEVNYLPNNSGSNPGGVFFYGNSIPVANFGTGHTLI